MKLLVLDMKRFSLITLIFFCTISFSQSKNEKEERIDASEFPEVARSYFNAILNQVNYLKFYKETDGNKHSFEVKFKLNKLRYSVEFDTIGNLEDIEIIIREKHIPKSNLKNIKSFFNTTFDNVRIIKIQEQYINNSEINDQQFINHILEKKSNKNNLFEIIAEVKQNHKRQLKEFTFNNNGELIKSRLVKSEGYQYALY